MLRPSLTTELLVQVSWASPNRWPVEMTTSLLYHHVYMFSSAICIQNLTYLLCQMQTFINLYLNKPSTMGGGLCPRKETYSLLLFVWGYCWISFIEGTSTLGRTRKPSHTQDLQSPISESHSQQRPLETDSSQNYLELPDPDTHILIADEESQEGDKSDSKYSNIACRPAEGKVRHWSEDQPRTGENSAMKLFSRLSEIK